MSSSCKLKPGQFRSDIHRLLQAAEDGHKADILAYSSGHLGPRSLVQSHPFKETKQPFWSTSEKQRETPKPLTPRKRQTKAVKKNMKDYLAEVTANFTSLTIDQALAADNPSDFSFDAVPREDICLNKMLPSIRKPLPKIQPKSTGPKKSKYTSNPAVRQDGSDKADLSMEEQMKISHVLVKHNVWTGTNAAEIHERKLQRELQKLSTQSWPSRDRLAAFSDVFDDVCESSLVFGRILREIKNDYDLYANHMMTALQNMPSHHSLIRPGSKAPTLDLEDKEEVVRLLELEAKESLEENRRLKNELQTVLGGSCSEDKDMDVDSDTADGCDTTARSNRLQVLCMWTQIQQLEEEIQDKLVSSDITTAIERRVRALKTGIMKLMTSNNQLETTNSDLENQISAALGKEKIRSATKQRLWYETKPNL